MRHVLVLSRKPEKGQAIEDLVALFEAILNILFPMIQQKQLNGR